MSASMPANGYGWDQASESSESTIWAPYQWVQAWYCQIRSHLPEMFDREEWICASIPQNLSTNQSTHECGHMMCKSLVGTIKSSEPSILGGELSLD